MGIDPVTHKPKNNPGGSAQSSKHAADLSHMAQWETARLEAEARLTRSSKLLFNRHLHRNLTAPPPPLPPQQQLAALPCLDVLKVWQATTGPNCFFGSPASLESPTSTLNFSSSSVPVPTVTAVTADDVVMYANSYDVACGVGVKGKMENSLLLHDDNDFAFPVNYEYDHMMGMMDLAAANENPNGYNMDDYVVTEFEEDDNNYWNELLNLVSSESPGF